MLRTAFMTIFWGLVMVVLDFRINHLDLIPDFIGYALIFKGVRQLAPLHASFGTASLPALAMVVLALPDLVGVQHPLLAVLGIVGDLLIFWPVCTGINALATAAGNGGLAGAAHNVRTLQVFVSAVALLGQLFLRADPQSAKVLLLPLLIFALAVAALTLYLLRRASIELPAVEGG